MVVRLDGQGCVGMLMLKMLARVPPAGVAWESPPSLQAQRRVKSHYHQPRAATICFSLPPSRSLEYPGRNRER